MAYVLVGNASCSRHAAPIPDSPAPMIRTSKWSSRTAGLLPVGRRPARHVGRAPDPGSPAPQESCQVVAERLAADRLLLPQPPVADRLDVPHHPERPGQRGPRVEPAGPQPVAEDAGEPAGHRV